MAANGAVTNVMVAGVGGQGSILTSYLLTQASLKAKKDVKVAETFGAATRGGSVLAHVRIGEVWAPMMSEDEADFILALEPLEGLRVSVKYLKPNGWIFLNTRPWLPVDVNTGRAAYPTIDKIIEALKKLQAKVVPVDATQLAIDAGDVRAANSVILGCLIGSGEFELTEDLIFSAMRERWPSKLVDLNIKAFQSGYKNTKNMIFDI